MLFNSLEFILIYLPVVFSGAFLLRRRPRRLLLWLALASFAFYSRWHWPDLLVLTVSIALNYPLGRLVSHHARVKPDRAARWVALGVALNLLLLGFFKYGDFFISQGNQLLGWQLPLLGIALPLGISFFTFHQISYLVDLKGGIAKQSDLLPYCFSVAFFPQLIAGPIVRFREIVPQLVGPSATLGLRRDDIQVGISQFAFGLFKKVVIADSMIVFVGPVFSAAEAGQVASTTEAWIACVAFALQLYFDFSAYSDMALGLARCFGIKLPANFNSPYKATSIIDFWRRWHITLSRFLRDYLYVPLGGNRKGPLRRYINLIITMLLGGFWHGAGWTFLLWGALHGLALCLCHLWQALLRRLGQSVAIGPVARFIAWAVTLIFVVLAWIPFRAESLAGVETVLQGLFLAPEAGFTLRRLEDALPVFLAFYIAVRLPNLEQVMAAASPVLVPTAAPLQGWRQKYLTWSPTRSWAWITGLVFAIAISNCFSNTAFLYYDF